MNTVTRITKEELINVVITNFKQNKDLLLNIGSIGDATIFKRTKKIDGHAIDFYYDNTSYVNMEVVGTFWDKVFQKHHVVIAINTMCNKLSVRGGNIAMVNVKANELTQEGLETVIVDSKINIALFKGKSKVIFSKLKGIDYVVDSDIFATLCQTTSATFISSEIKMCRFVTEQVKYVNEIVHDTTVDTERTQLMKSLMTMKKSFESI